MKDKNILIVGASSGIGHALAEKLAIEGANLYLISRTQPNIAGGNFEYLEADVLKKEIDSSFLPEQIDGVVYCPGSINLKPVRSLSEDDYRNDFEINVIGAVKTIKAALRPMKKSSNASIVLFSTVAVQQGMAFHGSVAAAKGAIEGITRSFAAELAPRIRVNAVAPSLVDTPLASKILSSEDRIEASKQRHPLKRIGSPDDIANTVKFLLSDEASWMTGQIIGVDGGLSRLR